MRRLIILCVVVAMVMVIVPPAAANELPVATCPPDNPAVDWGITKAGELFASKDRNGDGYVCLAVMPGAPPGVVLMLLAIDNNVPIR